MDTHIITIRRQEVEQEIVRLKSRMAEMEIELVDLATAERVLAKLTGAIGQSPRTADEPKPPRALVANPADKMNLRELIIGALQSAKDEGLLGLKPVQIQQRIVDVYGVDKSRNVVNTRTWRLWKEDGILDKQGDGTYSLSEKIEAEGTLNLEPAPTASDINPVHGREAGQGGGT